MKKISVAIATFNEEENIGPCLESVHQLADEMIVVDGSSQDKTREIARKHGARVIKTTNKPIFHINKQMAVDACKGEWILQLDADERVTSKLAEEILKIFSMNDDKIEEYQKTLPQRRLFLKHQEIVEKRDGKIGQERGEYVGFFLPRLNYFLGRYLRHGGVYPDGVIRLVKNSKARFPCQSVHEQIKINGRVGWLQNALLHLADPNFSRYRLRFNRYTDLMVNEMEEKKVDIGLINGFDYLLAKPLHWFFLTYFRHKGFMDGFPGFVFSLFSGLRFTVAYIKYWGKQNEN